MNCDCPKSCCGCSDSPKPVPVQMSASGSSDQPPVERTITVTIVMSQYDATKLHQTWRTYKTTSSGVMERFKGHVAKAIGEVL